MFDPYYLWLSIPPEEQPPNFYRLLGVRPFETAADAIDHAAQRAAMHVAGFRTTAYRAEAERILAEIRTAHATLLDPEQRPAYDRELYAQMQQSPLQATGPAQPGDIVKAPVVIHVPLPPIPTPAPVVVHVPLGPQTGGLLEQAEAGARQGEAWPRADAQLPHATRRDASAREAASGLSLGQPVKIMLGGIAGLALGYVLVYLLVGEDVLGLLPHRGPPPAAKAPP